MTLDYYNDTLLIVLQRNYELCFQKMRQQVKKENKGEKAWELALAAAVELTKQMAITAARLEEDLDQYKEEESVALDQHLGDMEKKELEEALGELTITQQEAELGFPNEAVIAGTTSNLA